MHLVKKSMLKKIIYWYFFFHYKECPSICTAEYDPVCGSDGLTYSNGCNLEVKKCMENPNLQVSSKGECPSQG